MSRLNADSSFLNHLDGEVTTLATLWKVIRTDGVIKCFTDHVRDINYQGQLYNAASGFQPTAIQVKNDLSIDNVEGILDHNEISEQDLQAGRYDFAELEIHLINYEDTSQNGMLLKRGWLGEVTLERGQFTAEVRGLTQIITQNIGRVYSPTCDANLGDERCGVDLGPWTSRNWVATVSSNSEFVAVDPFEDSTFFKGGVVTWVTGANQGLSMEVKSFVWADVTLVLPMGMSIEVGDAFDIVTGCDKTRRICRGKFNNLPNFRGFPDLPGQDKIFETSSTRSGG